MQHLMLIDTHTHFDLPEFDIDRITQAKLAFDNGVKHLVLIGFLAKYFQQMVACQTQMRDFIQQNQPSPIPHLAFGLHPFYITQHHDNDLLILEQFIKQYQSVAIGEIGLDTFTDEMKQTQNYAKQQDFFIKQLSLATQYQLPVLLHIRKAHAAAIRILKQQKFCQGGIAHSFSGGIQEAKTFVNLGFKIGITGQITNPNAKKLRTTVVELVKTVGLDSLVIETDCPDFTPICCHQSHKRRNTPANLVFVLDELSILLNIDKQLLAEQLWQNSIKALPNLTKFNV
ncbi:TatD-related deoxyribonuclease [Moraxella macacae 0408225]|uniref:TatD-related deoxyribonuclease n=1 Tax=Moraxella macacae 0408225 TaxID=1230338 RepID=L2F986_9GAMM|nr:TatD family hydrolase [Moraxella macacae]ELA09614.1 TatD-related deoxyribonuclease [Moraxella macacae 0408225]